MLRDTNIQYTEIYTFIAESELIYSASVPISIDESETASPAEERPNGHRVLEFLVEHRDKAFKASEIAAGPDVHENSVHPVLHRLESQDLVRHRAPYWALGDLETVGAALGYHEVAAFLDDALGPERRREWLAAEEDGE